MLVRDVGARGLATPRDNPIDKKYLYRMLSNRAYLSEAVHKGDNCPGDPPRFLGREVRRECQARSCGLRGADGRWVARGDSMGMRVAQAELGHGDLLCAGLMAGNWRAQYRDRRRRHSPYGMTGVVLQATLADLRIASLHRRRVDLRSISTGSPCRRSQQLRIDRDHTISTGCVN